MIGRLQGITETLLDRAERIQIADDRISGVKAAFRMSHAAGFQVRSRALQAAGVQANAMQQTAFKRLEE